MIFRIKEFISKRNIKEGEVIRITLMPDGTLESEDIEIKKDK